MKKLGMYVLVALALVLAGIGASAALADNGNGHSPPGGDNPCPPSYHAEGDTCVHNGDGGGNCGQNQSDNGGDHGYGNGEGCGSSTTTTTVVTTTTEEPPVTTTTETSGPPTGCAGKYGTDGQPGNDDCAPPPTTTVTASTPAPPSTPETATTPTAPTTEKPAAVTSRPAKKAVKKAKRPIVSSASVAGQVLPNTGLGLDLAFIAGLLLLASGLYLRHRAAGWDAWDNTDEVEGNGLALPGSFSAREITELEARASLSESGSGR
jgi:LPXTG-motif cell wall-anchored protein